ncbi:MAG: DUF177 domain-containing protein [Clostridia bacterium]|nr:DUF177 domain-containing protein [Clostridia bacterium]
MKIDLTTVLNKRADKLDFEYELDLSCSGYEDMMPDDIELTKPAKVSGTVKDQNNCMSLSCLVTLPYHTRCDRCLDDIDGVLSFEIEKTISENDAPQNAEDDPTYDDVLFVNESSVCLDAAVAEEAAVRLPPYHLCSDDCPGLCPKCGKKLADGPCGCSEKKEIDPRLKILQKLLDNFE